MNGLTNCRHQTEIARTQLLRMHPETMERDQLVLLRSTLLTAYKTNITLLDVIDALKTVVSIHERGVPHG